MQPTANPTIMLTFLRKGDPKISVRMMAINDRNPRPMNSGDPHGRGLGAKMVGHSSKMPEVAVAQPLEPPAQLGAPDEPTSEAPIRSTTVPMEVDVGAGVDEDKDVDKDVDVMVMIWF